MSGHLAGGLPVFRSSGSSLPRLVPRCCWPEDNPPAGGYGEVEKVAMRSARATTGAAGDHRIQAPAAAGLATARVLPLLHALAAAADYRLIVLDAQLPVPAPSAAYTDRTWARLRVGMHDAEIRRLPAFLQAIRRRIRTNAATPPSDIWVRTAPERGLRIILPTQPPRSTAGSRHVLASDIRACERYRRARCCQERKPS